MNLKPSGIYGAHRINEEIGIDHRYSASAAFDEVGIQHDGGVILHHAINIDFDARRTEVALRIFLPLILKCHELFFGSEVIPQ